MRVLHLYAGNLYGGIETYLVTLAKFSGLPTEMESEFGLCFRGRLWTELIATGVPVHDLGEVKFSRPWTLLRARWRLRQLLRKKRFDAVLTHACWPHAAFASVVRDAGLQLANRVHDSLNGRNWDERRAAKTLPDIVLVNSLYSIGSTSSVFPNVRTELLYPASIRPGTSLENGRKETRARLGCSESKVVILQASRLERWKGHLVHLEALGRLRNVPNWELWMTGEPQKSGEAKYLGELKSVAKQMGINDRVRFLGQWKDMPDLMAASDIFCQPNTSPEPFGLVYVEALYAGLPAIASAAGGPAEIIDSTCGVLTSPGDVHAVATALCSLIGDPSRRQLLGSAGPGRATELCDPIHHVRRMAKCFSKQ